MNYNLSIILPAKNEGVALAELLPKLREHYPKAEIIVVNDGSTDNTSQVCQINGIEEVKHPYSMGNGAAIKAGARRANGDVLVFMDSDGQHNPAEIGRLLEKFEEGYDMVVGARNSSSQASWGRLTANTIYNKLASLLVGHRVPDLTSGFRVINAKFFNQFIHLLPNGFSYPTTITMAFFRAGYRISYIPIQANKRIGKSHINITKDGIRFFLIIFKVGTLYSPLKIFLPISAVVMALGIGRYVYTYITSGTFTNMSALLLSVSVIIFLIGLVSEQITMLIYQTDKS